MGTFYVDNLLGNDANAGTSPGSGNAFATVQKGLDQLTSTGNIVHVRQTGTDYTISTGLTTPSAGGSAYTGLNRVCGYNTVTGDGGKPTIRATAGIDLLTVSSFGFRLEDMDFDGNNVGSTRGIIANVVEFNGGIVRCLIRRMAGLGIITNGSVLLDSEVKGCGGSAAIEVVSTTYAPIENCWVHDNSSTYGIYQSNFPTCVTRSRITNNAGVGMYLGYKSHAKGNTVHGNGGTGIVLLANFATIVEGIRDNILTNNGGYGIAFESSPDSASYVQAVIDFNAFYGNTSGARQYFAASPNDVTLSALPYTNAAGDDYSLNATAGAGAACRGVAHPLPGGGTSYQDLGAVQHQDAGGGSSPIFIID